MAELELTDASFDGEVLGAAQPVLVDFWAPWCGPCRAFAPVVAELAEDFDGRIKVAKLNTEENPESPKRYKIGAIPTLILFKGGQALEKIVGAGSKREIAKLLEAALAA